MFYFDFISQALIQAIGRGIRHENDYCMILLVDKRFKYGNFPFKLSNKRLEDIATFFK